MTGTILTAVGKAKIASATPEAQLQITHVAVGDGNGSYPVLTENMVALANEVWRGTSSNPIRDVQATNTLMFESAIPPDVGGFTIREIGIFDVDGDMIAIGHVDPAQVKPLATTTTAVNMTVRMIIALENAEQTNLVLQVAPVVTHNGLADREVFGAHPASAIVDATRGDQQSVNDSIFDKLDKSEIHVAATGDMTTDTSNLAEAIVLAALSGQSIVGRGDFKINQTLNLRRLHVDFSNSSIEIVDSLAMVRIGGASSTTINKNQSFGRVFRSTGLEKTIPTLRMEGSKDQFIHIQACDYLQVYADTTNASADGSIAYCTFALGKIDKLELTNNPANTIPDSGGNGGAIQWINENRIILQRCADLIVSGTYNHNHNKIYGGTYESGSKITFLSGWDNYIDGARFENGATVTFAAGTERNVVINTWDSSTSGVANTATVIDNGFDNIVIDDFSLYHNSETVAYTDISDVVLDTQVAQSRSSDLQRVFSLGSNSVLSKSDFIAAIAGDYYRWVSISETGSTEDANSRYRPRIEFFDAKLQPITASPDFISGTGGAFSIISGNYIGTGTNVNAAMLCLLPAAISAGVRFVKVSWYSNSPFTASISTAVSLYIARYSKNTDPYKATSNRVNSIENPFVVTAKPAKGFAPLGLVAVKSDGTDRYTNIFALDTTLISYSGADIVVTTATGVLVGDIVGVNLDDRSTHWTTVSAVNGATLTLVNGIPSAAATGSRVVFNRWYYRPLSTAIYDPPSLAAGAVQSTTVSLNGAVVGNAVACSFNQPLQGTRMWAEVTAVNTVTVYHQNPTAAPVDVVSGTLTVKLI